jgi:hypothetical protein
MNSLRSAWTAVLAGLPDPPIRAKGNYELARAMVITGNQNLGVDKTS